MHDRHRRRWRRHAPVVAVLLAGLLGVSSSGAAAARPTTGATSQARGIVALYAMQVGAPVLLVTYSTCASPVQRSVPSRVTGFNNLPLPGCQVLLVNDKAQRLTLCDGRGTIPVPFQRSRQLLIQKGATPPCRTPQT
jgi:hypothetical protein